MKTLKGHSLGFWMRGIWVCLSLILAGGAIESDAEVAIILLINLCLSVWATYHYDKKEWDKVTKDLYNETNGGK